MFYCFSLDELVFESSSLPNLDTVTPCLCYCSIFSWICMFTWKSA